MANLISTFQKAFLRGYATSELNVKTMFICVILTGLIALYICYVYKRAHSDAFFDKEFLLSLFGIAVITSAIILTIQSNIVVSLGMVGALSIVRFRTAIKRPMDLFFLFWSISVGIICGAGFAMIAVIASIILTIGIVVFNNLPKEKDTMMLIINASKYDEEEFSKVIGKYSPKMKVRSRNLNGVSVDMAIEVRPDNPEVLLKELSELESITRVSLVDHDGEVTR